MKWVSSNGELKTGHFAGKSESLPRHIAIIMDGNGRWARARRLPRAEGHRYGGKAVRRIVEECRRRGVEYLTLFAFSTENWQRPEDEVRSLMNLFVQYLEGELKLLLKNDIRLRSIGDTSRLSEKVQSSLRNCEEKTKDCKSMQLIIAISYGGRHEILNAVKRIACDMKSGVVSEAEFDEAMFSRYLYTADIPDPDLLIRTSDEHRISNFLLWQLAYAEIVVTPVLWPDFDEKQLALCLAEYEKRERRFGLTKEQLEKGENSEAHDS